MTLLMLSACAEEATPVVDYPEMGSPVMQLYLVKCGDCHRAPLPSSHTAAVWPGVLQRMQMRMQAKARKPLDKNELSQIMDYVQRHAGMSHQQ